MTFKDIVAQLLERGNAMQTFWGFYISISVGLIAFVGNAKRNKRSPVVAAILSIAFIAFATVNYSGMADITDQRSVFYERLGEAAAIDIATADNITVARAELNGTIALELSRYRPPTRAEVRMFHLIADVLVLAAIWTLTLWKEEKKTPEEIKLTAIGEIVQT
jgi:NO-binding membrane sensor protein with MHYT domain